jgi:stage III sporulation protein SpoIIIAA
MSNPLTVEVHWTPEMEEQLKSALMQVAEAETKLYAEATEDANERGCWCIANYMAHGYHLEEVKKVAVLQKGKDVLVIDKEGKMIKGVRAIG